MWPIRPIHFWLIFIMKLLNSNMHETHSVFIISAIETLALQKYNSMSADEKRGLVAKYIAGGGIKGNLQQILSTVESSGSSKEISSEVIEGYMPLGKVELYFLFPPNNFYGLYITLRPLLWGVMHRVRNFLWRDPEGSHISYRHIFIYIFTYFVYPFLIIFSNIFTHIDIYIHAYSLAPSRYIHKPHPAFHLKQHAFYIFSSGQLLRSWSTMGGAGQI